MKTTLEMKTTSKNEDNFKNVADLQNEDNHKNEETLRIKTTTIKDDLKNEGNLNVKMT